MQTNTKLSAKPKTIAKSAAKIFLLLFGATLVVASIIFFNRTNTQRKLIEEQEKAHVEFQRKYIVLGLEEIVSDLLFLSRCCQDDGAFSEDSTISAQEKADLTKEFIFFSASHKTYDQIRFLDIHGNEVIRLNSNAGRPMAVPDSKLQNKKDRYYFKDTVRLSRGQVYVSPLDLNIEHGKIEQPRKPMIRYGTLVFDKKGQKVGVLILNYLAGYLLNRLGELEQTSLGSSMLLNNKGYWLKGPSRENEWGFMYENRKHDTFGNFDPEAWQIIQANEEGQTETGQGLVTFASVYPLKETLVSSDGSGDPYGSSTTRLDSEAYFWKTVSFISKKALYSERNTRFRWLVMILVLLGVVLGTVSWQMAVTISVRRQAETVLKTSHDILEERVKKRTSELEQTNQELQQFAHVASHDLQEPLRMVSSYARLLAERNKGKLDKDSDEFIEYVVEGAIRMRDLINDLLALSRVDTRGEKMISVDSSEILKDTLKNLEVLIQESKANIKSGNLPRVTADRGQLGLLFQNLIVNAIKYQRNGNPEIMVSGNRKGRFWHFAVRDNGIGIDKEYFERIFIIFQRLHGKEEYSGTGIGLALCKKIVNRHGGKIWVESEPGKGSTFFFTIPV